MLKSANQFVQGQFGGLAEAGDEVVVDRNLVIDAPEPAERDPLVEERLGVQVTAIRIYRSRKFIRNRRESRN